jgi:hypothetical protein
VLETLLYGTENIVCKTNVVQEIIKKSEALRIVCDGIANEYNNTLKWPDCAYPPEIFQLCFVDALIKITSIPRY